MLTEPRIFRLGSSLFSFISLSATPTSDHLNGHRQTGRGRVTSLKSAPDFSDFTVEANNVKMRTLMIKVKFQREPRGTDDSPLPVSFISDLESISASE